MPELIDAVRQTVSGTPGTGTITLSTAEAGFSILSDHAEVVNGTELYLSIIDGSNMETGIYTWNTGDTLSRTTIIAKLTAGVWDDTSPTALSLTSAAIIVSSASKASFDRPHAFRGALVNKSANQTGLSDATWTSLSFNTEEYDTDSFHDNATNNTRITIPTGVTKVAFSYGAQIDSNSTTRVGIRLRKNNATFLGESAFLLHVTSSSLDKYLCATSPVLEVVSGDYFEAHAFIDGSSSRNVIAGSRTYFSVEVK